MYRRILCPLDGSGPSVAGLREAVGLARQYGARLRLLHVVDDLVTAPLALGAGAPGGFACVVDALRDEGRKLLARAAEDAQAEAVAAEPVQLEAQGRSVAEVILGEAEQWGADLLVMGTHGRRGLNRLLLGSDAEGVVREASVPVLLTRKNAGRGGAARER